MKKLVLFTLIFMMAFTVVFSQAPGTFTVGARGGLGIGFNDFSSAAKSEFRDDWGLGNNWDRWISMESLLHPVISAFGFYTFAPNMAVQLEANIMINQGARVIIHEDVASIMSFGFITAEMTTEYKFVSLDVPVLFRYTFMDAPVSVGLLAGPYLSIPVGKLKTTMTIKGDTGSSSGEVDMEGVGFGAAAGLFVAYPMGPGSIVGDVRFLFDFVHPKIKGTTDPMWNRRALNITAGYQMTF